MKLRKKVLATLLAGLLVFGAVACGGGGGAGDSGGTSGETES